MINNQWESIFRTHLCQWPRIVWTIPQVLFWNGFKSPVHGGQTEPPQLPASPLPRMKESTAWFLRIFSIYYRSRQLLWKCNTKSLCHSVCSSTGKFWEVHSWSIVDHKLLSRWKIIATANVTGKNPTHMNRRTKWEEHWRGGGANFKWKTQQRGHGETARLCKVEGDSPSPGSNLHVCEVGPGAPLTPTGETITTAMPQLSVAEAHGVKKKWKDLSS